jgi:hypothetical protein
VAHAHSTSSACVHRVHSPRLAGPASACVARDGAARERTPELSPLSGRGRRRRYNGGGGAKDGARAPTAERLPTGHGVEAIAQRSSLSTGRGRKNGSAAAFFDEARAPVARGGPASGWRESKLGSTFHGRKSSKRGLGLRSPWKSSRRRRSPDSDGGALGQQRSAPNTDDGVVGTGAREVRRGDGAARTTGRRGRDGYRDAGALSRQRPYGV